MYTMFAFFRKLGPTVHITYLKLCQAYQDHSIFRNGVLYDVIPHVESYARKLTISEMCLNENGRRAKCKRHFHVSS